MCAKINSNKAGRGPGAALQGRNGVGDRLRITDPSPNEPNRKKKITITIDR